MSSQILINRRLDLLAFAITLSCFIVVKLVIDTRFDDIQTKEQNKHALILEQVQARITLFEASRIRALESLAKNWPSAHPNLQQWFTNESLDILYILPAINSLWFLADDKSSIWRVPTISGEFADLSSFAFPQNVDSLNVVTQQLVIGENRQAIAYGKPLFMDGSLFGWLIAVVDIENAFSFVVQDYIQSGKLTHFTIANDIVTPVNIDEIGKTNETIVYQNAAMFGEIPLNLYLHWLDTNPSRMGYLYLGMAISILFGLILRMLFYKSAKAQVSQQRFVAASKSSLDGLLLFSKAQDEYVLSDFNSVAEQMLGNSLSGHSLSYSQLLDSLCLNKAELLQAPARALAGHSFDDSFHVVPSVNAIEYIKLQIVSAGSDIAVTIRDITPRKIAELSLREREEKYRRLVEGLTGHFLYTIDSDGEFSYISNSVSFILGYSSDDFLANYQLYLTDSPINDIITKRVCWSFVNDQQSYHLEFKTKQGQIKLIEFTDSPVLEDNVQVAIEGIAKDITKENALANEIAYQANHDALTGLYNRYAFDQQLKKVIKQVLNDGLEATLCYLDLDQFKIVNDTAGHLAGDELLNQLGMLIPQTIDERHIVARLGGDEFGVLFVACSSEYVEREARKLLERINEFRFVWEDNLFRVGASIGLATIKLGHTAEELMKAADVACYVAKDSGRNRISVYSEDDEDLNYHKSRINWANRIQEALEQNQFRLFCQKIESLDESLKNEINFEMLLRMSDSEGELISPALFIPAAERFNLMGAIDRWVVSEALRLLAISPQLLAIVNKCAINLSGASITDESFADHIITQMTKLRIPPEKICFEITETEAVTKLNNAKCFISMLRTFGCKFALDDFGAGMCSFSYLKHLPVDYVKIDGHFIKNLQHEPTDRAIVKSINDIASSLGKLTIAEFVGDEQTKQILSKIGVDYVQGYYVSKPEPFEEYVNAFESTVQLALNVC